MFNGRDISGGKNFSNKGQKQIFFNRNSYSAKTPLWLKNCFSFVELKTSVLSLPLKESTECWVFFLIQLTKTPLEVCEDLTVLLTDELQRMKHLGRETSSTEGWPDGQDTEHIPHASLSTHTYNHTTTPSL